LTSEDENGEISEIFSTSNNYQRFFYLNKKIKSKAVRLTILKVRQAGDSRIFAFDLD